MMDRSAKTALANAAAKVKAVVTRAVMRKTEDVGGIIVAAIDYMAQQPDGVELFQPQGLYVRPPATSEALAFAPTANASALVCGLAFDRDQTPAEGGLGEGEGGLHYLGAFKAFMAADGTIHLGAKTADDWVPLDSAVQTELARLKAELDAVKADFDSLKTTFDAHTHPYVDSPVGPSVTSPVASPWSGPTVAPADPGETKSSTARVQS